ncbi:slr2071 [Synechocystis sp. PCC 6803]|jgi:hypothetical protein|uniref:Slr2071 protein n=1 Tax=Synechocystis sp. (strain ATCC 27184 / PCC 6803 / Kazusa) TaxID=1111708 RepID=P73371_SYNY3|nr:MULTISPECIES: hypothetical protein [unclassified Synechocystis]WLT39841.1 hypothetical protein NON20_10910 [Synechocystis sp. B12]BAM51128.1 hypothetical protein BEST7613_2197 [Synechocystis sp. PCC 6803] [Bacillus subtilis BEST7613]AGF51091.1 hypothetical protein MYO_18330 [Synechocystis sp. PCC 6803]ALJ67123.1 hypothetical protein AOY38_04250 [Synechocystis sp. PCC 6803]AVP88964.1 hypothetical protein C7I86_04255 [Synechocystis sp. IPPAS B-1465]
MFKFLANNYSQSLGLTACLGLFTYLAIAVPVEAQGQNSFENYRQQCLRRVEQAGIKGAAAQEMCNCTINKFKQKYSLAEFTKLVQQSETNQAIARQLAEVGEECLYE